MGNNTVFALWPYIAIVVLAAGTLLRYLLVLRQPLALAAEMADAKAAFGGRLFWISIVALVSLHLAGLLFPRAVLAWNSNTAGLYLLEGLALAAGLAAVAGSTVLIWRHLGRSGRSPVTEFFDTVFLGVIFTVLLSGVLTAIFYRWGSSWGVMTLGPYVASLVRGQPAVQLATQMPALVRLHMLATFAAIALLPLTRLSTFLIAAVHGCTVLIGRPFRTAGDAITEWSRKHNPGNWFWPEED